MDNKGKFIVFEGLDGAGLSTQALRLENYLGARGRQVLLTKEPTAGLLGGILKSTLRGELKLSSRALQLLFSADRAQHVDTEIVPALAEGKIVISDRYFYSTFAYGIASEVEYDWLLDINRKFLVPDMTILLDVEPETSLKRMSQGRFTSELFEKKESLTKVRNAFLTLAKEFNFRVISGEGSIEQVSDRIAEAVDSLLQSQ